MEAIRFRNGDPPAVVTRSFQIGKIRDIDSRTVEAVISSEYPVPRYDGNEILVHSSDAVDLSRAPLPLIIAHDDRTLPVGIVESLRIENKELIGVLRFSKSQDAVWQDVQDGILRSLSVGYITNRIEPPENGEYRVTQWQPYECSLVAAPADPTAKIKRDLNNNNRSDTVDINDLKKERKLAKDEMVTLAKNRELSAEQKTKLAALKETVSTLTMQIEALEMDEGQTTEDDKNRTANDRKCRLQIQGMNHNSRPFASDEYKRTYDKFLRHGRAALYPDEIRALSVGSDPSMGYIVPDEFETQLVQSLKDNNIMRTLCRVISTAGDRKIPIVVGDSAAYWLNENGSYIESDVELAQKTLGAHKLGVLCLASEELAFDAGFPLASFLAENFGRSMGDKEEAAFISGDGNEKPTGIIQDAEVGLITANATAITSDELLDLLHSLKRVYRKRASFLMADDTLKLIRKLKDGNGRYLFEESLQAGEPSTLLGKPIHISDSVPGATAGNKSILFGDYSYYWIADRQGRFFQELREKYADKGQIGYRANQRIDGKLTLPEAVKTLQMKA
ncbi:MAG: phage major capsid protein [Proteobacteria bacterium]|nr:phage major capsid protein [Desulfobacula sp.]MBU4131224.1 phage major capsid protein [Pseudomonadota bacterium]